MYKSICIKYLTICILNLIFFNSNVSYFKIKLTLFIMMKLGPIQLNVKSKNSLNRNSTVIIKLNINAL